MNIFCETMYVSRIGFRKKSLLGTNEICYTKVVRITEEGSYISIFAAVKNICQYFTGMAFIIEYFLIFIPWIENRFDVSRQLALRLK